jgi:hypothetical protein
MPSKRPSSGKAAQKSARYDPLGDDDKDGIKNFREHELGTNHRQSDTDGDGINDAKEDKLGTDPTKADTDGDGLSDKRELAIKTNPHKRDSDGDGINDREELQVGTDPKVRTEKAEYRKILDTDGDGLTDDEEAKLGTDPKNYDTDGDYWLDGEEAQFGMDPLDPAWRDPPRDFRQDLDAMDSGPVSGSMMTQASMSGSGSGSGSGSVSGSGIDPDLIEMDSPSVRDFLRNASHQLGDKHQRMAEADPKAEDPDTWDSSELVEWSAKRAGITMPDGSWKQYDYLAKKGSTVSVEEALRTPGALVFTFPNGVSGPGGSRPTGAGVGISMGDGRVMEVRQGGEVMLTNDVTRYTHAGVMEEVADAHNPGSDASSIVDVVTGERYADALTGGAEGGLREWPPLVIPPKDVEPDDETVPTDDSPNAGDPPEVEVPTEVEEPTDEVPTDEMPNSADPPDDEEPTDEEPTDEEPTDEEPTDEVPGDGEPTEEVPGNGENPEPRGLEDGQPEPEPDDAPSDPFADSDGDGLSDMWERGASHTDPNNPDTDGLSDGVEHRSPGENESRFDPLKPDTDDDGVGDGDEAGRGLDPRSADSDGDGWTDRDELDWGTDPSNGLDAPAEELRDLMHSNAEPIGPEAPPDEEMEMDPADPTGSVDETLAEPAPIDSFEPIEEPNFEPIEEPSYVEPEPIVEEASTDGSLESI